MSDGGQVGIRTMSAAAERDGVDVRVSHRVQRLVMEGGAVVGVEATGPDGTVRVAARKAVIFATGGFTHDPELRANFLSAPVYGGCAAITNEGDFVRIGAAAGAQLRNMNQAWMCPVPLEAAVERRPELSGMFSRGRRLDAVRRQDRAAAWSTRSCRTTSWRRRSSSGTRCAASIRTWC